ncbi:Tyrosinase [Beauveria bassiana D1-5]|uniref:tyrosinase n=1 Tax=Beauveria bassiana D1-5 TaxID=1245745 RepID=A0A0A2VDR5_BEABA|nr:Tyrosinase [Beauveria bassiana D1-5]
MLPDYQLFIAAGTLLLTQVTQTSASVIVTGPRVDPNAPSVPPRRSIVDFYATGGPQWDLYIQALGAMQAADATDPESYFQISGIHGKPFAEYDGTGPMNTSGWAGYCPHMQTLVSHARKIAVQYPEEHRSKYIEAADTLRSPFWDWATDRAVPQATVPQTLTINVSEDGRLEARIVENSLYTFKFPQAVLEGHFGEFDHEKRTQVYRCNQLFMSYPETANANIRAKNYKQSLYDSFTRSTDFRQFATMDSTGNSLEAIHGSIHWDAACQGQFLTVEFTGFDPLFMMHHTNVDRLWAYWQVMHPDQQLFSGEYLSKPRWGTPENTTITTKSPLQPFRRTETEFHTSETVQSIHDLGYSYPGLEFRSRNWDEMRAEVTRIINGLQPQLSSLGTRQANGEPDDGRVMSTRYFAHLTVELSQVERPCSIEVSMNGSYSGNLVLMSMPEFGVAHGEIPLDSVHNLLQGKSSSVVLDTLESWLDVEIMKIDGSTMALADVPSLGVQIEEVQVAAPRSDTELPQYSHSRIFGIRLGRKTTN